MPDTATTRSSPPALFSCLTFGHDRLRGYRLPPDATVDNTGWLGPLGKLNIFVGPNNAGKSRVLRGLFEGPLIGVPPIPDAESIVEVAASARPAVAQVDAAIGSQAVDRGVAQHLSRVRLIVQGATGGRALLMSDRGQRALESLEGLRKALPGIPGYPALGLRDAEAVLRDTFTRLAPLVEKVAAPAQAIRPVYVPTLRGLRPLGARDHSMKERTEKDLFSRAPMGNGGSRLDKNKHVIFTGEQAHHQVREMQLGDLDARERLVALEAFLSNRFFEGQRVALVPKQTSKTPEGEHPHDVLTVKVYPEAERPIYELGDGLQHLIIMTLPLFLYGDEPLALFIEEPENFLHPGFQRLFVEALLQAPANQPRQVFMSTHSNHFLDMTLDQSDISIFSVRKLLPVEGGNAKIPAFDIHPVSTARMPVLAELGVRNSSVLLTNCTIWVEGITDRMYYRHYLMLFMKEAHSKASSTPVFVEDLHFSFVEYGGSNIAHLAALNKDGGINVDRLCGLMMLVADSDPGKEKRRATLAAVLGDRFVPLPCLEVENLLTPETIRRVVLGYEAKEAPDLQSFSEVDFKTEPLGTFIEESVLPREYTSVRRGNPPYADESGTIKDKMGFARRAIEAMPGWADLSANAQAIAEQMYRFIAKANS